MKENEWRQQVLALFEALERQLEQINRRIDQMNLRIEALEGQADIWSALKQSILAEDRDE